MYRVQFGILGLLTARDSGFRGYMEFKVKDLISCHCGIGPADTPGNRTYTPGALYIHESAKSSAVHDLSPQTCGNPDIRKFKFCRQSQILHPQAVRGL